MFHWNYYRFIEKADQEINLVLSTLTASSHRDNTIIFFTVDHGEAAGAHRMFQKFTLYEESIHVPFVIATLNESGNLNFDDSAADEQSKMSTHLFKTDISIPRNRTDDKQEAVQ
jgi:glucan phosphoethanolaminetransferase (alkaline phosphatase superfamily)